MGRERDGVMQKPPSVSGHADGEAVCVGRGIWTPAYLDSNPGVGPGCGSVAESLLMGALSSFSQMIGLRLLGYLTLRKTAPPRPQSLPL